MKKKSVKVITQILIKAAAFAVQNRNTALFDKLLLCHVGQSKKIM